MTHGSVVNNRGFHNVQKLPTILHFDVKTTLLYLEMVYIHQTHGIDRQYEHEDLSYLMCVMSNPLSRYSGVRLFFSSTPHQRG